MKIVLIDDDRDDGQLLKEVLEEIDSGIEFIHHEEPKHGLEKLLNELNRTPNLIFLDINMPIINGWQCLKEFKKHDHLKNIPVIMYTTSSLQREKDIANDLGADGFITKPDDYLRLKEMLESVVKNAIS
jgi:CheY-like chemotaxis protein